MLCANCQTENRPDRKFCRSCGSELARPCPTCGCLNEPEDAFCGECGAAIGSSLPGVGTAPPGRQGVTQASEGDGALAGGARATELRHVSVLFCDLVGFTPLSESKDPEEVRELLSAYFDLARAIVARYGGVIEKFIGDAVMAVWGAPVANEDDAERAVRAALELVAAVATYGVRARPPASPRESASSPAERPRPRPPKRAWSSATESTRPPVSSRLLRPGCCYVDEATRRATAAAVAYLDAGTHSLKGKAEPARLHQALRIVAGVGGALKSEGLEAPFVGRDRELRLVKDLFHASAQDKRAHLVSVTGIAGIGKSRLAWEFYKYMDGLSRRVQLAPRSLPLLRRRRRLLGTGRDGSQQGEDPRRRGRRLGVGQASSRGRGVAPRPGGTALGRAATRPSARPGRSQRPGQRGPVRRLEALLRAHVGGTPRRAESSRTCSGRTRHSSTSSSTCSSGRETMPSSYSPCRALNSSSAGPTGERGVATSLPST